MTTVIAFDVNETLLDLRVLDSAFEELLGSSTLRAQWFAQMLQLSCVGGLGARSPRLRRPVAASVRTGR